MKKKSNKKSPVVRASFDGIANKFDANIYGTTKGQLRHQLLLFHLSEYIETGKLQHVDDKETPINEQLGSFNRISDQPIKQLKVADVGAGTGMMALEFAKHGHKVDLYDVSEEALDIAKQRLTGFPNIRFICDSFANIEGSYDFIVCHALLEWLPDPFLVITTLIEHLKPEGTMSLSFFNHDAKVFNNLLYGNFDYVRAGMPARNTVRLNPHNAQEIPVIMAFIESIPRIKVLDSNGIRCIHDYMLDKSRIEPQYESLFELELAYGAKAPFKYLGKYFHITLSKTV